MADRLGQLEAESGLLTYDDVRQVKCPQCHAQPDEKCRKGGTTPSGGYRHMNDVHPERYRAAAAGRR